LEINPSTFPALKPGVCSGLILSGTFHPVLKDRVGAVEVSIHEIEIKHIFDSIVSWNLTGFLPGNLFPFKVDQICCYERGQFEDFELTFHPEIIDNIVYVTAPRDKVLWYPSTILH
jgi:hypothetical protein